MVKKLDGHESFLESMMSDTIVAGIEQIVKRLCTKGVPPLTNNHEMGSQTKILSVLCVDRSPYKNRI